MHGVIHKHVYARCPYVHYQTKEQFEIHYNVTLKYCLIVHVGYICKSILINISNWCILYLVLLL